MPQKGIRVLASPLESYRAQTGADGDGCIVDEIGPRQSGNDLAAQAIQLQGGLKRTDHREFIATKTGNHRSFALKDVTQTLGNLPDDLIASAMAHRVIDRLEPIQVHHDENLFMPRPSRE